MGYIGGMQGLYGGYIGVIFGYWKRKWKLLEYIGVYYIGVILG